jgi:LPPG:FO 2-phospho-L-lactate transferase
MAPPIVVLAGGTGGAKLARGMLDVVGSDLVVVANTADDVEVHGAYVSPDPDLITFWLADEIDRRGWGLRGDTFAVMDALRKMGEDVWFNLGDRDLAIGLRRAWRLAEGARLTEVAAELAETFGIEARVLPMSDAPVRTQVQARDRWMGLQEFLIREGGEGPVQDVRFEGASTATATSEVLGAISSARAIVIGPSNPIVSIGPMLALSGMRAALRAARGPVVAVSPLVDGRVLKGPTAPFMEWAGLTVDAAGIADVYAWVIDGLVADERTDRVPLLQTPVLLSTPKQRRSVARETLRFAAALR